MLIDARTFPAGHSLEADICLIGAGAAGIAIARELAKSSAKVLLLESGGFDFDPDIESLYDGETTGYAYPHPLAFARLRYFGGSTNHYGGACRIHDPVDFEARDWLPGSGWPFSYQHLAPFSARAQQVFQISPDGFDTDVWVRGSGYPRIDADPKRLVTKIWQTNPLRFGSVYRGELVKAPGVTVCLYATVVGFDTDRGGSRVIKLRCGAPGGLRFNVASRVYVVCCGGIENARLLLIAKEERSLPIDKGGVLGRFFMEHLVIHEAAEFSPMPRGPTPRELYVPAGLNGYWFHGMLAVSDELARHEHLQSVTFLIDQPERPTGRAALSEIWSALRQGRLPERPGDALGRIFEGLDDRIDQMYRHTFNSRSGVFNKLHPFEPGTLSAYVEQAPNRESRISLTDARDGMGQRRVQLHWQLSRSDKRSLLRALEILGAELARLGVARIRVKLTQNLDEWPNDLTTHCHHMGTTRMDPDPKQGVVDEHCRVHGVENLYVAGSSVYPTVGSSAPTLTIVALALRLADRLKQEAK